MKINTDLKLFTAEVTLPYYYIGNENIVIYIVAKNIEEALAVAKEYVAEHHVMLKLINNDAKTIYMLGEIE